MAWLIALIAAFAVFATVGSQYRDAKADVSGFTMALSGGFTGNVAVGATATYTITIAPSATPAPTVGSMNFNVILNTAIGNIANIDTSGFSGMQNNYCSVTSSGGGTSNRIDCTYPPFMPAGAGGTITFQATALSPAVIGAGAQAGQCAEVDNGSVSFANCTDNTLAATIVGLVAGTTTKTHSPASLTSAGGSFTSTIAVTNTSTLVSTGGSITITDAIPAGVTVTAISANAPALGSGVQLGIANCGQTLPVAGPVNLVCTLTFIPADWDPTEAINLVVTQSVGANSGAARSFTNTATVTGIQWGGVNVATDTQADTINQDAAAVVNDTSSVELWHLAPYGGAPVAGRDQDSNVVGFLHKVCAQNADVDSLWPDSSQTTYQRGAGWNFKIDTISGAANINSPVVAVGVDCDGDNFADDSTISWYSTQPGEQNITVVDDNGTVKIDSNTTAGLPNPAVPLVKEWNTLSPTVIAASGSLTATAAAALTAATGNLDGTTSALGTTFNPGTGAYVGATKTVYEYVLATHTNAAGTQVYLATGAKVTIKKTGTCGNVSISGGFITTGTYAPVGSLTNIDATTGTVVYTNGAGPIAVTMKTDVTNGGTACTSLTTGATGFTAQADYPALLGSNQPPAPALEKYGVTYTSVVPTKQVFLAWAGQRVILEHDWRVPAGDTSIITDTARAACPFADNQQIQYIKGSGPGNFLTGLNAVVHGNDQAIVTLQPDYLGQVGDVPGHPQSACISRVLYESEDPGEVDIEAFAIDGFGHNSAVNATKVAFVVYYMKLNTVNVSLVTQVSKPSHNGSDFSSYPDYAPGNPWDASKDDADNAADWNVSKDLLVRGRVTGWFTNSNPSGRAADTSNPLNVLPANRWVMPADWPLLAGGPADPADGTDAKGTAEYFRPEYDILFAPNNTAGVALQTPAGTGATQITTVAAAVTAKVVAGTFTVVDATSLPLTGQVIVGTTPVNYTRVGNTLTITSFAAPAGSTIVPTSLTAAAGTAVFIVSGVPFEGPFSLIDIPGLYASGLGGAALSNSVASALRDTNLPDGDVDWWDAPMPPSLVSIDITGTGFIRQVTKANTYYNGTANSTTQNYPNPFYIVNIPDSPFIPANVAGGGYFWDSWGNDGPLGIASEFAPTAPNNGQGVYTFWQPIAAFMAGTLGTNPFGFVDATMTASNIAELGQIQVATSDPTADRTLVVYSDNHGEFMVSANGDLKTDLTACSTNALGGGKHCKTGDKVGTGKISATADYPDFRGKHFPVLSNVATVTWLWGGYKDVTVEAGETDQYKYVVFHAMDRDGFCSAPTGGVLLHSVLSVTDGLSTINGSGTANAGDPIESVNFLIDSGEGIILGSSGAPTGATASTPVAVINDGKQFANTVPTYSIAAEAAAATGKKVFPLSSLAATGQTDECQAWIKVSNSLLGVLNVLAIAADDEGPIGFDKIIDLTNTTSYTLNFRWSLVTWAGANNIAVADALKGTGTSGKNPGGNDISASVTAIYGWDQAAQQWLGYFPSGVNVPGANDLTALKDGSAYWIAITGPGSVTWTIASNVD